MVNKKKVQRLWAEEGLQCRMRSRRKRIGASSHPQVCADAPKLVWALDFQFDSTIDGKAVKIASMLDEHTGGSLLNIVGRSITAERLIEDLERSFAAAGGPLMVLRMDNGPEMIYQALQQFCEGQVGLVYIPPGTLCNNGFIEWFNNRRRKECLNRNHWTNLLEACVAIADFEHEHSSAHRHSALGDLTPAECAAHAATPIAQWSARSTEIGINNLACETRRTDYRGPVIGFSPVLEGSLQPGGVSGR